MAGLCRVRSDGAAESFRAVSDGATDTTVCAAVPGAAVPEVTAPGAAPGSCRTGPAGSVP
ncbi:hypothetical protein [Streptomyces albireticuli]|uniref:hypothetical protein n=1 Tax=Streptomyces albireticuli TaxID=1940 RepID=UPI0011812D5F|nr:hypothetical protein [Streptomyces albireticuli]MCD9141096.1 hypothetical protein [Streptomyces albireticuli]MCD9160943.1 hypothetical protein [Streptomyces albireticuli]MCD9191000.1 hypothetical protein [Streptomyces albireticuli]